MRFTKKLSLQEVLSIISVKEVIGNKYSEVKGINEIHKIEEGDLTFVDAPKYYQKTLGTKAHFVIMDQRPQVETDKVILLSDEPFEAYNDLVKHFRPLIHLDGLKGKEVSIAPDAIIEPGVVIGNKVTIGSGSYIQANAYIGDHTVIGDRVNIQAGAIIGTDAFYYKKKESAYHKWRSGGRVIIENDVEIGAGCTINKGVSGDTIIGAGSKLDCQIHLGHGVVIGKNCLLAAQVGIGGKTIIGDRVVMYGQVGVAQNLVIGDDTVILAKSGISKNLKGNKTYFGYPAAEVYTKYKELATVRILTKEMQAKGKH